MNSAAPITTERDTMHFNVYRLTFTYDCDCEAAPVTMDYSDLTPVEEYRVDFRKHHPCPACGVKTANVTRQVTGMGTAR